MKLNRIEKIIGQYSKDFGPKKIEDMKREVSQTAIKDLNSQARIDLRETHVIEREGISIAATERILGVNDLMDINYFAKGIDVSRSVCRIILRDVNLREVGYATGFKPSPNLLITNFHVFNNKEDAKNAVIEFSFELNIQGNPKPTTRFRLSPEQFFVNNENLDYAIVAINPVAIFGNQKLSDFGFLRLNPQLGKINKGEYATIIQHPGGQSKQIAIRDNQIISDIDENDFTLMYYSDTAQGSSGAPVFNDSWQVVALHYTGIPRTDENGNWLLKNGSIATRFDDDADVDWISNSGIRASRIVNDFAARNDGGSSNYKTEFMDVCSGKLVSTLELEEMIPTPENSVSTMPVVTQPEPEAVTTDTFVNFSGGSLLHQQLINLPLTISVHLGAMGSTANNGNGVPSNDVFGLEVTKEPFHDLDYTTRKGFDEDFLGMKVPLPKVYNSSSLSKMANGAYYIPYHKFTVVNNKKRKLALFTASNIDASKTAKKPEPGKKYTRAALADLGKNDKEKWFVDPRIPAEDQLSDDFYNKDRTAFDKGHLVRREDVAWGKDYLDVKFSNGDTYHITNCSPQVLGFNRSMEGGKWGELENNVLKQAKKEKLVVFSGPVLKDEDPLFNGVNLSENVKIPIPRAYWKVIVAVSESGALESFAFLLAQDLSLVQFEFDVGEEWKTYMISMEQLEEFTTNIIFPSIVKEADQYQSVTGNLIINENDLEVLAVAPQTR